MVSHSEIKVLLSVLQHWVVFHFDFKELSTAEVFIADQFGIFSVSFVALRLNFLYMFVIECF